MSFYAGVVPADGLSAQASAISRTHPQTSPGAISPPAAQFSDYGAPVTPAQAYARSVVSAQPTLQYIIERQQPPNTSVQQPASLLQSPVEAPTSIRGQSYAQRLYSSALGKQRQPQSTLHADNRELSSSGPGEPGSNILAPGMPSRPHGARPRAVSSLLLNTSHTNLSSPDSSQPVSALDFYHSSVSKLGFQPPSDQSTRPAGPRRPQSVMSSSTRVSVPHSPPPVAFPTSQAPRDIHVTRGGTLPSERDHQLSTPMELGSMSPPNLVPPLPGRFASPDSAQISSRSVSFCSNTVLSPVSSELVPREFSPNSEDHSRDIPSRSATPSIHLAPIPIHSASLDLSPEDVPSYSLVDNIPPPPDFDESQSICNANSPPSINHAEVPVVLSPPDAPSPSPPPHEPGAIYRAVPSIGASPPPNLSPDPSLESPRPISAMGGVPTYYPEKTLVHVAEKLYGYPVEDLVPRLPEKARSYATKEPLSYKQREHNTSSNDVRCPPAPSAVTTHYRSTSNNSANTTAPPAPPPTLPTSSAPASITTSAPPPTLPITPSLGPKPSIINPANVQPVTSQPLRPDNTIQRSIPPPLPPRVRSESKSSPSSAFIPSSVSGPAAMPSQPYPTPSYSPLPSPFPQHSQARSVLPMPSTSNRPADVRPQLSPPLSPVWHRAVQVPYQSPLQAQALSPPPQRPGAQNVTASSPQTNRNLGSITAGIAGGALGLLGGAVLAEVLSGGEIVDDLAGNMAGMTFEDPTSGFLDFTMDAGDQFSGSGFDPTAGFQGDQTFSEDSFVPIYDTADPNMGYGLDSYQTAGYQEQPSTLPDPYSASEQQETQQSDITEPYNMSQYQQQPNDHNGNGGTHYMHDAEQILQAAYKIYHAAQQSGVAQGSQSPQTTAPLQQSVSANPDVSLNSGLPISPSASYISTSSAGQNAGVHASFASVPFHGASFSPTATQHNGQFTHAATSPTIQPPAATTFSQHHPSVHPVSQQIIHPPSHHLAFTQGSHSHTQNSYINHTAYPSSGSALHTVSSHSSMQAQHIMHYGTGYPHDTSSHHTSLQSHAHGQYSTHSGSYIPQGSSQQQSHTAQHPSSASTAQNKATLARQVVKGALIAGGVLAKYNKLTGGQGFVGNNGGFS